MFPEWGHRDVVRQPSLAASYHEISRKGGGGVGWGHHCKRLSLASLKETFLTVPYMSLGKGLYEAVVSCYHSVVSN